MSVNKCKSCGAEIEWMRTPAGKLMPVSVATGLSHFQDCPQAKDWSKSNGPRKSKPAAVPQDTPLPF